MNLPIILTFGAALLAVGMLALAFAGPSAGKAKTRRLSSVKDRHAASTEAVVAAQMRKTIAAAGNSGNTSISSLMPRRELMELRLRRTGKGWTLSKYMFASMALFVVVAGGMLSVRAPFMLALMFGLLAGVGLPHMVVGRIIKKRVLKFNARFPDAIDLLVRGLKSGLPVTETFQVVSQELPGPVGEEFRGIVERIRIGNTMEPTGRASRLTEADLHEAYHRTLIVLFRLLFTAYAEDRGLLPVDTNPRYQRKSLRVIARDLTEDPDIDFSDEATDLWEDLQSVWRAIDDGNSDWDVPAYNGGLFAADDLHPSGQALAATTLTNAQIGPALRALLVDINEDGERGPVDFRAITVREFGTIYEGLLEPRTVSRSPSPKDRCTSITPPGNESPPALTSPRSSRSSISSTQPWTPPSTSTSTRSPHTSHQATKQRLSTSFSISASPTSPWAQPTSLWPPLTASRPR